MTPIDHKGPTTEDLKKLTTEELIIRLMHDCKERHTETLARLEQVDAAIGQVAQEVKTLQMDVRALGAMAARAIEAQLDPIRQRIGGIADDTSAVRRTVNGANFLAHTQLRELEQRVAALESKHAANGGGE